MRALNDFGAGVPSSLHIIPGSPNVMANLICRCLRIGLYGHAAPHFTAIEVTPASRARYPASVARRSEPRRVELPEILILDQPIPLLLPGARS